MIGHSATSTRTRLHRESLSGWLHQVPAAHKGRSPGLLPRTLRSQLPSKPRLLPELATTALKGGSRQSTADNPAESGMRAHAKIFAQRHVCMLAVHHLIRPKPNGVASTVALCSSADARSFEGAMGRHVLQHQPREAVQQGQITTTLCAPMLMPSGMGVGYRA